LPRPGFENLIGKSGRRLQDRHVGARRLPLDGRRRRARLRAPRARRDDARAPTAQIVRRAAGDLQMVQGHIADMALDVDAAALLVYRAAWTKDMGAPRVTREAAMAKLYATDKAQEVIDKRGAAAWRRRRAQGAIVESLYREIRALRIYEGASDVQKVVIARQVMQ
jgi:acyl-CoA dehydrogenase